MNSFRLKNGQSEKINTMKVVQRTIKVANAYKLNKSLYENKNETKKKKHYTQLFNHQ